MNEVKERGAAQFVAKLSDGVITITHTTENGPVLAKWTAEAGDWDKLWITINELKATAQNE